jgi:MFS family permease
MASIAVGHGIKHWYISAFTVFLPLLEQEYALSVLGVSILVAVRQLGSGLPNFIVGYVSDRLRNYWHLLLPASLLGAAGCYMLAGLSPWYWTVVAFISLAGASAAFWHPPAISMLSARFPTRRGMAIAVHGAGSGAGEALGPLGVGLILVLLLADNWRLYVVLSMGPAVLLAVMLYSFLSGAWQPQRSEEHAPVKLTDLFTLLRYPVFLSLAAANMIRSFAHFGLLAFLPLYLARDLGMNSAGVGAHIALLTLLGVGAGPFYGYLSDRIGRRVPMVVAMVAIGLGFLSMGIVGSGVPLVVALGLTGIFLWSIQDVINATAMDAAPPGTEGTVVGLMFSSSFVAGVAAPMVAGLVVTLTGDRISVFFLSAAVIAPAAVLLAFAPLHRKAAPA